MFADILAVSPSFEHRLPKVLDMKNGVDMKNIYSRFFDRSPGAGEEPRLREDELSVVTRDRRPETISRRQRILVLQHTPALPKRRRGAPREGWKPPPLEVKKIEFYKDADVTLETFLKTTCFDALQMAGGAGGGGKKSDRKDTRTYTHENSRLTIHVLPLRQGHRPGLQVPGAGDDDYLTWSSCKASGRATACHKMTKEALSCSFGKLLEAYFHDDITVHSETGNSLYRDHVRYFSYRSLVAKFEYTQTEIYECSLPRTEQLSDNGQKQVAEWNESVDRVRMAVQWTYNKAMKILPDLIAQEPNDQLQEKLQSMLKTMDAECRKLTADLDALPSALDSGVVELLPCLVDLGNLTFYLQEREEAFLVLLQSLFGVVSHGSRHRSRHAKTLSFEHEALEGIAEHARAEGAGEVHRAGLEFQESDMGEPHPMLQPMLESAKLKKWRQLEKLTADYKEEYEGQLGEYSEEDAVDAAVELKIDTNMIPAGETLGLLHLLVLSDQTAVLWRLYENFGIDFEAIRCTHEEVPRTAHDMCSPSGGMADLLAHIMKGRPGENDSLVPGFQATSEEDPTAVAEAAGEVAAPGVDEYFAPPASVLAACKEYDAKEAAGELDEDGSLPTDLRQAISVTPDGSMPSAAPPVEEAVPPKSSMGFTMDIPPFGGTQAGDAAAAAPEPESVAILTDDGLPYVSPLVVRLQPRLSHSNLLDTMIRLTTAEDSAPAMVQPEEVVDFFKADSGFQSSRLSSGSMANSGMAAEKNVIIYESEPSSLVAHALNSSRYRDFIEGCTSSLEGMLTTEGGLTYGGGDRSRIVSMKSILFSMKVIVFGLFWTEFWSILTQDFTYEVTAKDVSGEAATFRCTAVHAAHFHALREKYCDGDGDSSYIASMMHCKDWSDNNGGRCDSSSPSPVFLRSAPTFVHKSVPHLPLLRGAP